MYQFAQGFQQGRILVLYGIADHDGFAAAEGKVRERIFVGHVAGEAKCVFERIGVVAIVPLSASTEGRSSARVVDRNNRLKVAFAVESSDHSFVITYPSGFDDLHGASFRLIYRRLYLHHAKFFTTRVMQHQTAGTIHFSVRYLCVNIGQMKRKIIIDCDPGQDDAIALLLAFAASDALDLWALPVLPGTLDCR